MDGNAPIYFSGEEVQTTLPQTNYGSTSNSPDVPGANSVERRASMRFLMELDADVHTRGDRFQGRTINISSGGLLMNCGDRGEVGMLVTVRLAWPIPQRNKRVTLVVHGEIIRRDAGTVAVRQQRHEFEVAPTSSTSRSSTFSMDQTRRFLTSIREFVNAPRFRPGHSINCPPLTSIVSPTT